ncbi:MAG: RodZ domain-containing protein [Acidimicrobiales bacterium]
MILGRDRRAAAIAESDDLTTWSVGDVARSLRRARTVQGLRLEEVGQGAGVPIKDLRALEAAALDRFPDSLSALRAVRRAGDYLGLAGDQLALVLMERWSGRPSRAGGSPDPTSLYRTPGTTDGRGFADLGPPTEVPGSVPLGATREELFGPVASGPGTSEVIIGHPTTLAGTVTTVAETDTFGGSTTGNGTTGEKETDPAAGDAASAEAGASAEAAADGDTDTDGDTDDPRDTGEVEAVGGEAYPTGGNGRRRLAGTVETPPLWLRLFVIGLVLAVLAGIAGIAAHELGGHSHPGTSAGGHGASAHGASAHGAGGTGPGHTASSGGHGPTWAVKATSSTSATIDVGAPSFVVTVSAVGYPTWLQVKSAAGSQPVFSGMLETGQSHSFTGRQSLAVEVGSVAGHVTVTAGGKRVGTYAPPAAPYTMSFTSTH